MTNWVTADTHFGHESIIKFCHRPFDNAQDMDEQLVYNWNRVVNKGDVVYHLGDFSLSNDSQYIDKLLSRLNGTKILIKGNHDKGATTNNRRWYKVLDYYEIKLNKQKIIMSHYSMRVWNQHLRGSWMLYGHSHGTLPDIGGLTMDVGVDCNDYRPISFEEIAQIMDHRSSPAQSVSTLEFLMDRFKPSAPTMNSDPYWRFVNGGWPMNHCQGPTIEAALSNVLEEFDKNE